MNILAIDTSTRNLSLALKCGQEKIISSQFKSISSLDEVIVKKISQLLSKKGLNLQQVDIIIIGLGPGYFTSLRVGLSTVKGLVFGTKTKVIGLSSLDAVAMNVRSKAGNVCVLMDAKRKMVYASLYEKKNGELIKKLDDKLCLIEEMADHWTENMTIVGSGIEVYESQINALIKKKNIKCQISSAKLSIPKSQHLITLTEDKVTQKNFNQIETLEPIYLYPENCQVR